MQNIKKQNKMLLLLEFFFLLKLLQGFAFSVLC